MGTASVQRDYDLLSLLMHHSSFFTAWDALEVEVGSYEPIAIWVSPLACQAPNSAVPEELVPAAASVSSAQGAYITAQLAKPPESGDHTDELSVHRR